MILAFETSTELCSVAYQNSIGTIFEKRIHGRSVHSDNLFLFIHELMKEHNFSIDQIHTVLVSNGPGSYTGLRIAASAVKGIFFQSNVAVFAVNTLVGFAASQLNSFKGVVHAIIDARRSHVYHKKFELSEQLIATSETTIMEISDLEVQLEPKQALIGTGIDRLDSKKLFELSIFQLDSISAANLIKLYNTFPLSSFFERSSLEMLNPNYISSSQVNNNSA